MLVGDPETAYLQDHQAIIIKFTAGYSTRLVCRRHGTGETRGVAHGRTRTGTDEHDRQEHHTPSTDKDQVQSGQTRGECKVHRRQASRV